MAILTGDQAFCATCFRCRNCKRKIENLRYARTSQGIFCMGCHETLMARRKKKSKAAAAAKARDKETSPMVTEKSLPALPPNVIPNNAFSNDRVDPDSDTPTELSPRLRPPHRHNDSASRGISIPARSPERPPPADTPSKSEGLTLPQTTYRKNRNSAIIPGAGGNNEDGDGFYISVGLDQSPGANGTPESGQDSSARRKDRDYFSTPKGASERRSESHSQASTPHIAFQDKGRQHSSDHIALAQSKAPSRKLSKSEKDRGKPSPDSDDVPPQEAPRSKNLARPRTNSSQSGQDIRQANGISKRTTDNRTSRASTDSIPHEDDESKASPDTDSKPGRSEKTIPRKELPASAAQNLSGSSTDKKSSSNAYMQPRSAPAPPGSRESANAKEDGSSPKVSPKLPRWSSGGDFSMDEDMARILGTDEGSSSILRRVSNVVRHGRTASTESGQHGHRMSHGRSISETTRAAMSPRWSRSQHHDDHANHEISSPVSFKSGDDPVILKRQLRNSEQRVAELERQFNTEKDLHSLNKKLVEKRKTVSVLDTQAEIMIRQLEVLAGYVEKAKETNDPIDVEELEESAIKDFVQKLERVKEAMSTEIEELHEQRDKLMEEKNQAVTDRDRALMEFEQLSSKNAQLADMNNDLTHQIQERFKSQVGDMRSSNGLGIYGNKGAAGSSSNIDTHSMATGTTLISADDDTIVESGPTVVQVRKGQVKKFNWKKGSKTMAQNVAKGVNRAVVAFQQNDRERAGMPGQAGLTADNIGLPYNMTVTPVDNAATPGAGGANNKQHLDPGRQGFGFFGKKNAMPKSVSANAMSTAPAAAEPPSVLFGSELEERAEFERRQIPSVITRCIEEVELRGMDQEGIYRKTGGNSQVNMIKDGFDKSENFDISDPDLDITAVTSVLKQYFRKLPTPLLTFDVYDRVLESNGMYFRYIRSPIIY